MIRSFKIILTFFLSVFLLLNCNNKETKTEQKEKPIARVFDSYLYPSDIKNIVPKDVSKKDSIQLIKNFINKWIQDELVLAHAQENLTTEQLDLEKQIAEYRKNLIIYNYQTELVIQKLDTNVSDSEIENYYNNNKDQFTLKDNIVKVWYIKTNKKIPNADKIKTWYKSDTKKDYIALKTYCIQFADNYFLDDENWILFDELLKEIPVSSLNPELFLKSNRYIEVEDSLSAYYVNIKGYRIKNSLSPLSFEKSNIKNILLNKRKLKLIEEMKKEVYEKAKQKENFEIY